jgi:hypothetical protein
LNGVLAIVLLAATAGHTAAQVEWFKDASAAQIPAGTVTGQIDGKAINALKFGHLDTAGGLMLGAPEMEFVHYKISLRDAEMFFDAKAFAYVTVTVRKGELPDGKTFRSIDTSWQEQPGIRGDGYWVPEFLSLGIETRKMSMQEQKAGESSHEARLTSGVELRFTGRVEFDKRKADKIGVRLYLCFADRAKSCLAGTAELEIR